ncbi:Thioredoxin reductase [Geodia barretti]|nr:Thioredoxin reductase [Geodia barretti]
MTAGMYAARHGLRTGIIERMMGGASIINVEKVENFPGFSEGIMGADLAAMTQEQAMTSGAEFVMGEVSGISTSGDYRIVSADSGDLQAKTVIVAAGSTLRLLGIPGEDEFTGRGVSQCATCDGPLYSGEVVGVVGGGDSATDEALVLAQYADRVLLFHRRDELRAQRELVDRVLAEPKIEVVWSTVIEEVLGENTVSGVSTTNMATGEKGARELSGLFVYVGLAPNGNIVDGLLETDGGDHIPVNISMETALPGVYAVGDIRQHSSSQLVSAAGDGATAAIAAFRYISGRSWD